MPQVLFLSVHDSQKLSRDDRNSQGQGTREVFVRAWSEKIPDLKIKMELGNSEAIKQAVLSNLGISCLSRKVIEENLRSNTLVVLKTLELEQRRKLYIIIHWEKYWTPLLSAFGDHCEFRHNNKSGG